MTPTPEMIEAGAIALANYEGAIMDIPQIASVEEFRFDSDRDDYLKRSELMIKAVLAAMWKPICQAPTMETVFGKGGGLNYPTTVCWSGIPDEPWYTDNQEDVHDEIDPPELFAPLSIFEDRK